MWWWSHKVEWHRVGYNHCFETCHVVAIRLLLVSLLCNSDIKILPVRAWHGTSMWLTWCSVAGMYLVAQAPTSCTASHRSAAVNARRVGDSACSLHEPNRWWTWLPSLLPNDYLRCFTFHTQCHVSSYSLHTETTHHQHIACHDCQPASRSSISNRLW